MKLILAVFGKSGSPFIADETARYVKRLAHSQMPLEIVELKESKKTGTQALAEEAADFEKKFPAKDFTRVILAEEGVLKTSEKLAYWIGSKTGNIVFLIGSAYGIDAKLKQTADLLLSLSPLTLTHDHARVIATEQLYRSAMILAGHPYHHR